MDTKKMSVEERQVLDKEGFYQACYFFNKEQKEILEKKWTCEAGKIDLIIRDGEDLVFVEVVTQKKYCSKEEMPKFKKKEIEEIAMSYFSINDIFSTRVRFDVVVVIIYDKTNALIKYYKDVSGTYNSLLTNNTLKSAFTAKRSLKALFTRCTQNKLRYLPGAPEYLFLRSQGMDNQEKDLQSPFLQRFGKVVYICSPYHASSDIEQQRNIRYAQGYARYAIENDRAPLVPHLFIPDVVGGDDGLQREIGLNIANTLLSKCDELWVCGDTVTEGMELEITCAIAYKKEIKHVSSLLARLHDCGLVEFKPFCEQCSLFNDGSCFGEPIYSRWTGCELSIPFGTEK